MAFGILRAHGGITAEKRFFLSSLSVEDERQIAAIRQHWSIDTNHGYAKRPVENSEVAKRWAALERKIAKVQRQARAAREHRERAFARSRTLEKRLKQERAEAGRTLAEHLQAWEQQGVWPFLVREKREAVQRETVARLAPLQQRKRHAEDAIVAAFATCERACQQECDLLRQLEDLKASERAMFELDHAKDQTMSVLKLALVNLVMWTRDHYFPAPYAQATWHRLAPFFRLPGQVVWGTDTVTVELRPFNDRRLTCDLAVLCQRVEAAQSRLPAGWRLVFHVASACPVPGAAYLDAVA